jgi:cytochrome c
MLPLVSWVITDTVRAQAAPPPAAFIQCAACHGVVAGDDRVGPSLAGIYGKKSGSLAGFRYSGAMKRSLLEWNETTLNAFLENPQATVPGNRMAFSGITDAGARAELIRYLRTLTAK